MRQIFSIALILTMVEISFSQGATSTALFGGRGGSAFTDPEPPAGTRVLEIHVRSGDHVDSVQMVLSHPDGRRITTTRRGGSGGRLNVFRLDSDEYITGASGRHGDYIDSISVTTNKRSSPVWGGRGGDRDFRLEVPAGNQAVGFAGRAGDFVDAIGLIFMPLQQTRAQQTALAGGRGGTAFSDSELPAGARIQAVRVYSGELIDAVQAVYVLPDGRTVDGQRFGGRGGQVSVFKLDSDEYITELSGRHGDSIDSLRIHTNKRTSQLFGGRGGNRDFRVTVPSGSQAIGFAGRAGQYVDAIGLTYTQGARPFRWRRR